jgi:hypothetical protein
MAGALVLAVQALGLPLLTREAPASCCCAHRSEQRKCPCKVCTHAREVAGNAPVLKTCGSTADAAGLVATHPVVPETQPAIRTRSLARRVPAPADLRAPDPLLEIPTPPPLALA